MSILYGVLRLLSSESDSGRPVSGQWLPERNCVFPIAQHLTTLGRGLHNAIVLFNDGVSTEHAMLKFSRGIWTITNVAQSEPLEVDGRTVLPGETSPIESGQHIRLGEASLQLVTPRNNETKHEKFAHVSHSALLLLKRGLTFDEHLFVVMIDWGSFLFTHQQWISAKGGWFGALTIPVVPVICVFFLVMLIDLYERNRWYILALSFGWGILAALIALRIEENLSPFLGALSTTLNLDLLPAFWRNPINSGMQAISISFIEESLKCLGVLFIIFLNRQRFQNIVDGILYGVVIGAGFGLFENIVKITSSDMQPFTILLIGKIVLRWVTHPTFTMCFGAILGYAQEHGQREHWWRKILLGAGLAILIHMIFDFVVFQTSVSYQVENPLIDAIILFVIIVTYILLFIIQGVFYFLLMRGLAREAAVLREYLIDEVQRGMITLEEYVILQQASFMLRLKRALLIASDIRLWIAVRNLFAAEVSLAFAKWSIARGTTGMTIIDEIDRARASIRDYRRIIARLENVGMH
jgi:RsiW-degrading membrane proteinase PrsW (M82 family)